MVNWIERIYHRRRRRAWVVETLLIRGHQHHDGRAGGAWELSLVS